MFSGKIILNFGFQKRLRAFLKPIFTGGVVEGNCICSAAFCESAALRESFWLNRKVYGSARSPLGELSRSD